MLTGIVNAWGSARTLGVYRNTVKKHIHHLKVLIIINFDKSGIFRKKLKISPVDGGSFYCFSVQGSDATMQTKETNAGH